MEENIKVDIEYDRLLEIVEESLRVFIDFYGEETGLDRDGIINQFKRILDSGMVSVMFMVPAPNKVLPDLKLRLDPRRRSALFLSGYKKKLAPLNQVIKNF